MKKRTFKQKIVDALLGREHQCIKCKEYVHRLDYTRELKICDNCGIRGSLRKRLDNI